jgi:hypothetical protein
LKTIDFPTFSRVCFYFKISNISHNLEKTVGYFRLFSGITVPKPCQALGKFYKPL